MKRLFALQMRYEVWHFVQFSKGPNPLPHSWSELAHASNRCKRGIDLSSLLRSKFPEFWTEVSHPIRMVLEYHLLVLFLDVAFRVRLGRSKHLVGINGVAAGINQQIPAIGCRFRFDCERLLDYSP